ncbi:nucleotidyltransferase family protein [Clostridium sp. 'White wine YQ']|uniref:nucleotidyltransferase family protein n=1 Tax=Clostridium sp. 'White wine YQ' TaxID=3027474 RepID=UPI002366B985|nr:nucleotidyltransferase family protein [Clostridium sp. 'White wine YQ']MDD7793616.1 nucleotidyltransferase family protein [Clostridium sp. 'White wine YQ']
MECNVLKAYNLDLSVQLDALEKILYSSDVIKTIIERAEELDIENYYIGAGCIAQTVWNYLSNKSLSYGIKDYDFVYFDSKNLNIEYENKVINKIRNLYTDIDIEIDIKNQARVHLWYMSHFGYDIAPYKSLEAAINTWPTTATAIGVRKDKNNKLKVYAPYGLNDLFGKVIRANKAQITKEIYEDKVEKWIEKWPDLKVIPWEK